MYLFARIVAREDADEEASGKTPAFRVSKHSPPCLGVVISVAGEIAGDYVRI